MPKKITTEDYIKKAIKIHGSKYNYTPTIYVHSQSKLQIMCNDHGSFTQIAHNHLAGRGCPICAKKLIPVIQPRTTSQFINEANETHNGKYDYTNTVYEHSHKKVTITCKVHGDFNQVASSHLEGRGCRQCAISGLPGSYTEDKFKNHPSLKHKSAILYCVKFTNETETFFKVGISVRSTRKRFTGNKYQNYDIEEISTIDTTLYDAFTKEQYILNEYKHLKYIPQYKFKGWTECFSVDMTSSLTLT